MKQLNFLLLLLLTSLAAMAQAQKTGMPIDQNATPETQKLFENMRKLAEKGTMFGHQDDLDYGVGWKEIMGRSDVNAVAGDYPAVYGWELGNLELGRTHNLDSVSFDKIRYYIVEAYKKNGISTVSWHLNNPYTGKNAWDVSSNQVVKSILPGAFSHEKYKVWLDTLASYFTSLKDENGTLVPVLFRPFHELSGSWFWWGTNLCTKEEYVQLWQFTVDYLKNEKQVHNLLYIFSTDVIADRKQYLDRYPGDNYADGFGIDIYHRDSTAGTKRFVSTLNRCLKIVSNEASARNKLGVLSETGLVLIPIKDWWTAVLWKNIQKFHLSYVLVWRNAYNMKNHYFAPYPGQVSAEDFKAFERKEDVFFLKDMPPMYRSK